MANTASHNRLFNIKAAILQGYRLHGPTLPFVVAKRFCTYQNRRFRPPTPFKFAGQTLAYEIHPFILDNERAVEIAIARAFLANKRGAILEVGNVLSNFFPFPHDVVDKYEKAPGVLNEDVITFSPPKKYDMIVTLSTLEHVGWDETPREPEKILKAFARLREILASNGALMATMPFGLNAYLDNLIRAKKTGFDQVRYLLRTTRDNQWREATLSETVATKFGDPFTCANAIMVGTIGKNIWTTA